MSLFFLFFPGLTWPLFAHFQLSWKEILFIQALSQSQRLPEEAEIQRKEMEAFALGKSNNFAKDRFEAKKRQKYYQKSQLARQYKKELKKAGYDAIGTTGAKASGGGKRPRDEPDSEVDGNHPSQKARPGAKLGEDEKSVDRGKGSQKLGKGQRKGQGKVQGGAGRADPFAKEKAVAAAARKAREDEAARIAGAEADRARKINFKKKMSRKQAERDSRGRPRVRNTVGLILQKLQNEAGK